MPRIIDYYLLLLVNLPAYKIRELQVIQYICLRSVLTYNRYTPINTMLKVLETMDVNNRTIFNTLTYCYL